jgi:hypothetical protein
MEKKTIIYHGGTQRSEYGSYRETRLVVEGNVLMAGSRGRALHMSVDGGDDTPWTESYLSDNVINALSGRNGAWFDTRSEKGKKIRRRCEDALRKCDDYTVIATVAALLNVTSPD